MPENKPYGPPKKKKRRGSIDPVFGSGGAHTSGKKRTTTPPTNKKAQKAVQGIGNAIKSVADSRSELRKEMEHSADYQTSQFKNLVKGNFKGLSLLKKKHRQERRTRGYE